jgi:hypothetical protein
MIWTKATIRARVLPRVIFLEVRLLELRNLMLCMSDILRGGLLEISLDSLSCPICGVLPGRLLSERCMPKIMFIYFECCKGFNDVDIQNIQEYLLGVGLCNCCGLRVKCRMFNRIPFSRLSLTFSHASLVVDSSARGSNEVSTDFALS